MMQLRAMRRWGRTLAGVALAAGSLLSMTSAKAQLIADDNFSYPTGPLADVGGGFGWSPVAGQGTWSSGNLNTVSNPGLTYVGLGALGGTATTNGSGSGAYRSMAVNQGSVNGTNTVYVSFLARKDPNDSTPIGGGSNTYAGISLFDGVSFGSVEKFFMGMPYENGNWGFDTKTDGVVTTSVPINSTVHLFVYRFDFTSSNVDVRLYVDPSTSAEPVSPSAQRLGLPGFNFQQVRIQSGVPDGVPHIDFDELKIAGDYATAVGVSLSGNVADYGSSINKAGKVITAKFRNPSNNAVVATRTATLDANGNFAFTSIPRGTYNILLSGNKVLSVGQTNVNLSNAINNAQYTFPGGDVNADNVVDIADLLLLIGAYNQVSPASGYLEAADFNDDGTNNITDLLTLITNYNKIGAN